MKLTGKLDRELEQEREEMDAGGRSRSSYGAPDEADLRALMSTQGGVKDP